MDDQCHSICDERVELMTSLFARGAPVRRTSYFLKPCAISVDESVFDISSLLPPLASTSEPETSPLKVRLSGWRQPSCYWTSWIDNLHPTYQSVWKESGIYESIKLTIRKENELVFNLAEKWSPETNTFIFPWGEATITLEDVMILGGFSVTGKSFLSANETCEFKEIEMSQKKTEAGRSKSQKASQSLWIKMFMNCGSEIEHEAFLVAWLSRFVLSDSGSIKKFLFPIVVYLSKGIRVAVAPAVLASIYGDLTILKAKMADSTKFINGGNKSSSSELHLWSPLQLVQLWGRFRNLQAKPIWTNPKSPPFARWHCVWGERIKNLRLALDSAGEIFQWRPYVNADICTEFSEKVYAESEKWVELGSDLNEELLSFALCLRVSQLVGINCMENYFPHRVAMQFGFDQDLPANVSFSNEFSDTALENYAKPFLDRKLYVPSRFFKPGVTALYFEWWKKSSSGLQDSIESGERRKISPRKTSSKKPVSAREIRHENGRILGGFYPGREHADVPAGFSPKHGITGAGGSSSMAEQREMDNSTTNQVSRNGDKREEDRRSMTELPGSSDYLAGEVFSCKRSSSKL